LIAEGAQCGVVGVSRSKARTALLFGFQVQVRAQFAREIVFTPPAPPPAHLSTSMVDILPSE
jgi:hypothetical protein